MATTTTATAAELEQALAGAIWEALEVYSSAVPSDMIEDAELVQMAEDIEGFSCPWTELTEDERGAFIKANRAAAMAMATCFALVLRRVADRKGLQT
jgi:hypothetical protein